MKTYFTADTHFGHSNIIKYNKRPFTDAKEMDQKLIRNWNERIQPGDTVYHVGDFCFSEKGQGILDQLNGNKHLILGNHDKEGRKLRGWASIEKLREIYVGNQMIVLCHYAMRVWNKSHHGTWHLYGHSHGSLLDDPNSLSFDVGVDCHDYKPLEFEDVARIMKKKTWKAIDHHGRKE